VARHWQLVQESFERSFDEMFDELLLSRWRLRTQGGGAGDSRLLEYEDRYEARVATGYADPRDVEVEVDDNRLMIAIRAGSFTPLKQVFSFAQQIDTPKVRARWWQGVLRVVLPKKSKTKSEER
jgi:HSP20 family molecular chaperone IbpA